MMTHAEYVAKVAGGKWAVKEFGMGEDPVRLRLADKFYDLVEHSHGEHRRGTEHLRFPMMRVDYQAQDGRWFEWWATKACACGLMAYTDPVVIHWRAGHA